VGVWTVFSSQKGSLCGVSGLGTSILLLLACKRDMTSHLVSFGINGKRGRGKTRITESELILNRAGLFGTLQKRGRNSGHENLSQTQKRINHRLATMERTTLLSSV